MLLWSDFTKFFQKRNIFMKMIHLKRICHQNYTILQQTNQCMVREPLIICALQKNLDIENLNTFFKKSKSNFSFVQSNHSFIILNVHLNPTIVLCITCINAILTDFLPIDLNEWARLLRRAFYLITIWRGGATLETLEVLNEEMEGRESESRKEIQLKNSRPYRTRFVTKFSKIPLLKHLS